MCLLIDGTSAACRNYCAQSIDSLTHPPIRPIMHTYTLITVNYRLTNVRETNCAHGGRKSLSLIELNNCLSRLDWAAFARANIASNTWLIHNCYCCRHWDRRIGFEEPWLVIKSGFKANIQDLTTNVCSQLYWCTSNWVIDHCTCFTELLNLVVTVETEGCQSTEKCSLPSKCSQWRD